MSQRLIKDFLKENNVKRIVILSPHMDDAVLSCGGLMSEFSKTVSITVVTFATKDPGKINRYESKFLTEVDLASPKKRIAEEKKAIGSLGVSLKDLGFLDAVYRRGKNKKLLYPTRLFNFKSVPRKDYPTLVALTRQLRALTKKGDLLLHPSGIGGHVDHVLCKIAAKRLRAVLKLAYEDFPYTVWSETSVPKKAFKVNYSLKRKVALIKIYKSQIKMLFGSPKNILQMLIHRSKSPTEFFIQ